MLAHRLEDRRTMRFRNGPVYSRFSGTFENSFK